MTFSPMLCVSAPCTSETIERLQGTHWWELKIDGVRGILAINAGTVKLTNRNGVDITYRYPELVTAALAKFGPAARLILDGEIAATDDRNLPSFKLTAKRDRQQNLAIIAGLAERSPVTFYAFDLLYQDGVDLRRSPWSMRSGLLGGVIADTPSHDRIVRNIGSSDGAELMELVRRFALEGLVAKRTDSPYGSGRRSQWVKVKPTLTASFIVTGTTPGSGTRQETFGALSLAVVDSDGALVNCGEVGSGFTQRDLQDVLTALLDNAELGVDLIVDVEFQEFTVDGSLRFPVFRGIRTDLTRADANRDQLEPPCTASPSTTAGSSTDTSQLAST